MPGDTEAFATGFPDRLVDAVELEETAVVGADFLLDVVVPPVGGELVGVGSFRAVGGDVVGAIEADDKFAVAGVVVEAASLGVPEQLDTEFGAGGFEGVDIADLGLDGSEVGHGVLGFRF